MDTSRISKIIVEAESKISTLDKALDSGSNDTAHWTLLILSGMMQDLRRLAEEEPVPIEIDKQKLSETFDAARAVMDRLKLGIDEGDYQLASTHLAVLYSSLFKIHELINAEKNKRERVEHTREHQGRVHSA